MVRSPALRQPLRRERSRRTAAQHGDRLHCFDPRWMPGRQDGPAADRRRATSPAMAGSADCAFPWDSLWRALAPPTCRPCGPARSSSTCRRCRGMPLGTNDTLARATSFSNETALTFTSMAFMSSPGRRALLADSRPRPASPLPDSECSWSRPPEAGQPPPARNVFTDPIIPSLTAKAPRCGRRRSAPRWTGCRRWSESSRRRELPVFRCGTCKCNPDP